MAKILEGTPQEKGASESESQSFLRKKRKCAGTRKKLEKSQLIRENPEQKIFRGRELSLP
jgi:hypothetical protein